MRRVFFKIFNLVVIQLLSFHSFICDICNPSFHLKSLRIVKQQKLTENKSKIYVIFVIYQKKHIPFYIKNIIANIKRRGLLLSVVVNYDTSNEVIEYLDKWCDKLTLRKNIGRDFGGYKDEITSIDLKKIDRLILINDSVFYFNRNLDSLFSDLLDRDHEWVCLYENFELRYHAQSFLLAFGSNIIHSELFKKYWENYKSYTSRRFSIEKGEKELTVVCKKTGHYPHVINSMEVLQRRLLAFTHKEFISLIDERWVSFSNPVYNIYYEEMQLILMPFRKNIFNKKLNCADTLISPHIVNQLILAITNSNPTHSAAYIFLKLFDKPYLKRDCVYRNYVAKSQFRQHLEDSNLDKSEIEECMKEIGIKGSSSDERGIWPKIKFRYGFM